MTTEQQARSIPWWLPPLPRAADRPATFADLWDAIFGRRIRFCRVELDGSWFVCRPHEVDDWRDGESTVYTITSVRMTQRQFDALPEFEGF